MEKIEKHVFGIVTAAIIATMVATLTVLRYQATQEQQRLHQRGVDTAAGVLPNQADHAPTAVANR